MQGERNTAGRLHRLSDPIEQGCEISLHSDQMDHIHPIRLSDPMLIDP